MRIWAERKGLKGWRGRGGFERLGMHGKLETLDKEKRVDRVERLERPELRERL